MGILRISKAKTEHTTETVNRSQNYSDPTEKTTSIDYYVYVDTNSDNEDAVLSASYGAVTIPAIGAEKDTDSRQRVIKRTANRYKDADSPSALIWVVNVEYQSTPVHTGMWGVEVNFGGVEYTGPAYQDRSDDEKPFLNSAGDPFDPPINLSWYDGELTYTFCSNTFDSDALDWCRGCTNSETVTFNWLGQSKSFPPNTLKLATDSTAQTIYEGGAYYWKACYKFQYRLEDTYALKVLDCGYRQLNDDGEKVNIVDANNDLVTRPMPLDGHGHVMPKSEDPTTNAVPLDFQSTWKVDFGALLTGLS